MIHLSRKSRLVALLGGTIAATYVCTALAGLRRGLPVTIDAAARKASGAAGSARNSPDANQYMYCALTGSTTTVTASCNAHDATTGVASCFTSNQNIIGAIRSMSSDSFVTFSWDTSKNCTSVQVAQGSHLEPKLP